jgi:DnaJ-class molecular chaperone
MAFGKRFSILQQESRTNKIVCTKCNGTGRIKERGNPVVCKSCKGMGTSSAAPEPTRLHPFT